MNTEELNREFGNIDLDLLDQILKGLVSQGDSILDAGCGEGRNMIYFFGEGYNIYGVDNNPNALKLATMLARTAGFADAHKRLMESDIGALPFDGGMFDVIIFNNVLHVADSIEQATKWISELNRVLRTDGKLFLKTEISGVVNEELLMEICTNIGFSRSAEMRLTRIGDREWVSAMFTKQARIAS